MVPPGLSRPSASAASIIRAAIRSFTDPPGFRYSTLASTRGANPLVTRPSRTSGVLPIRSTIDSAYFTVSSCQYRARSAQRARQRRDVGLARTRPWRQMDGSAQALVDDRHALPTGNAHGLQTELAV